MERLVKGDIVVVRFPFSDLTGSKKRPAYVAFVLDGDDYILAQITGSRHDRYSIPILYTDFEIGSLHVISSIRTNRLFTADVSLIPYKIGSLQQERIKTIQKKITELF